MADFSVYPDAIDGYAQMPLVVDDITRVDAVTLNRLRSAILQIEKELGVKPRGESYSSVRERIDFLESSIASISSQININKTDSSPTSILQNTAIGDGITPTETSSLYVKDFNVVDISFVVGNIDAISEVRMSVLYSLLENPGPYATNPEDWNKVLVGNITSGFSSVDLYTLSFNPTTYPELSVLPGSFGLSASVSGLNMMVLIWAEIGASASSDFSAVALRRV